MYNYVHTHTDTISTWNKNMQRQNLQKEKAKKKEAHKSHTSDESLFPLLFYTVFTFINI